MKQHKPRSCYIFSEKLLRDKYNLKTKNVKTRNRHNKHNKEINKFFIQT